MSFIRQAKLAYSKILRDFRKMVSITESQFLTCDYLIVILLLPSGVFRF